LLAAAGSRRGCGANRGGLEADWIRGQEAAADLDAAMAIVRDWVQGNADRRRRLNEIRICHDH
jgi:hypothetical protein